MPALFAKDQADVDQLAAQLEAASTQLTELQEEHSGDDAVFAGFDKINKAEHLMKMGFSW